MEEVLKKHFGFTDFTLKKLNGYENRNYLLASAGVKYIFKTYHYDEELYDIVQAQNKALLHLQKTPNNQFPKPIQFDNGQYLQTIDIDGQATLCRLLSFLEGDFAAEINRDSNYLASFGTFLANTNLKLQFFKDYAIRSRTFEWDLQHFLLNKAFVQDIADPSQCKIVEYFFDQFEEKVLPVIPSLRKQVIHNDANEWNVLTKDGEVSGMIDFGDLVYAPLINELGVALAYVCYDTENLLEDAAHVLTAYHKALPLEEQEVELLYYLIAARLCTSAIQAAHSRVRDPGNQYATSSESKAWTCLQKWMTINPVDANNRFRYAIDLGVLEKTNMQKEE